MIVNLLLKLSLLLTLLLPLSLGQQICIRQECAAQLAACTADCVKLMGKCHFECTLMSQGCMQDCMALNKEAKALLECSYNRCLNL